MESWRVYKIQNASLSDDGFKGKGSRRYELMWKRAACFKAFCWDKMGYSLTIEIPGSLGADVGFKCGIMRSQQPLSCVCDPHPAPMDGYGVFGLRHADDPARDGIHVDEEPARKVLPFPANGSCITMHYSGARRRILWLSVDGSAPVEVRFADEIMELPTREYYFPYFIMRDADIVVRLSLSSSEESRGTKRKRSIHEIAAHVERMWTERCDTDAEVVTASGRIQVHKSIVCSCPIFRVAFAGGYSETSTGKMNILDVSHSTVEALLQFIYIKEVPDGVKHHELLGLAHRFEQKDLVELCAHAIIEKVNPTNICEAVSTLRVLKGDPIVAEAWQKLRHKVTFSPSLLDELLLTVPSSTVVQVS